LISTNLDFDQERTVDVNETVFRNLIDTYVLIQCTLKPALKGTSI